MDFAKAFDRIETFCALQSAQRGGFTQEAVTCLQEAVGLCDADRRLICDRMPALGDASAASVLLGVVLGIFASES
jgi:hypothetical protein